MTEWGRVLAAELAVLFGDEESARTVLAEAGIEAGRVTFSGRAVDLWRSAVEEAEKSGQVDRLIQAALARYPQRERLLQAREGYAREADFFEPAI